MSFFLLFLIFVNIYAYKFGNSDFLQWKYILHLKNKNFGYINKQFYLSYPFVNAYNELILDLNEIKNKNKYFICNFPYRYLFLKKHFNLPKFDLKKCKNLQKFIHSFSNNKIGIVFSAEYSSSPQSSFGHVMLIFKNKYSLLDSDVIHFAAKPNMNDGFFKYSYNGLTGKYPAFYIREKFFKKQYLYNIVQQRTMYIYWLDFKKKEIKNLIYHLYELRKLKEKYYFTKINCSSALIDLFKAIDKDLPKKNTILPFLPIYSVELMKSRIKNIKILYPLEIQIIFLEKKLSFKEKEIFYNIVTLKNLKYNFNNLSNTLKELLYKYYRYKFVKYHFVYPNYNTIEKLKFKPVFINYINKDPLHKSKPSKISLKYKQDNTFLFSFRPFLIDINDNQNSLLDRKIYKIFTFELLIHNSKIKLNKFDIFNEKSLNIIYDPFLKPFSWGLNINLNRENRYKKLSFSSELNYGYTWNIYNTIYSLLGGVGIDINSKFKQLYLKPEVYIIKNFYKSSFIANIYYKTFENYKVFDISYNFYVKKFTLIVGKKISSNFNENYLGISINF